MKPHGGARFASAACAAVGTRHHDTAPTKSATATASGGESPVADSIFITGYQLGCQADACGGDVTIRSYAYLCVSTALTHTECAVYGDPLEI